MDQYTLGPRQPKPQPNSRSHSLWRGALSGALAFVVLAVFGIGIALIGYALIATDLPAPDDLQRRASSFQTTSIFDREGNLLTETFDPGTGRRTVMPLARISPYLQQATIAVEDANFYRHQGVDPVALTRALYYAVQEGDIVSGGSTIPQQLVKMVFLSPERTLRRKVNEAILSTEISRRYSKDRILETYLNELFYGNLAYGIDAAAETYFTKDASELTLGEATLLAGLPQLPAYYDPYSHPDRAKGRQSVVLGLMVENGVISQAEADAAWQEPLNYAPLEFNLEASHFTLYVQQQLESILGPEALYQTGLNVTTTLDPALQEAAERIVRDQVAQLADHNASNGALVAIRPETGEVLALVGSADFDNVEIDGQVNMALAPRQPGSSMKPFVYLSTFERADKPVEERWTPGTLVADIKEGFPDGANPPYVPVNYDGQDHGLVTVRTALGSSYNIPAVRALQEVGLTNFLALAERLGITTLTRPDYGLSLSLGGGEIPLMELTGAYAVLANDGERLPPATILEIRDSADNLLCRHGSERPCLPATPEELVVSPIDAFLITNILSDNEARMPSFGPNSLLRLDRPAAVKTGTTNDFRDNLTVGYTPQLVTGVWVGNADNSPMQNISGVSGAGPIWNQFMTTALANEPAVDFSPPPGVQLVEVCADTGVATQSAANAEGGDDGSRNDACPETRQLFFAIDRPPLPPELDLYQRVRLDKTTGKLATEFTPSGAIEEKVFKVYPDAYRAWAEEHGIPQPPRDQSEAFQFAPNVSMRQPVEGEVLNDVVTIIGSADVSAFQSYELQYGISHDPGAFSRPFSGPHGNPVIDGTLGHWDVRGLYNGPHTLRLVVRDTFGTEYETRVRVFVENVVPTPPPPATPTWTPLPPVDTPTPVVIDTATPTDLPPATPLPTLEPTAAPTIEPPTDVPTEVPTAVPPTATISAGPTPTWTPLPTTAPVTNTEVITGVNAGVLPIGGNADHTDGRNHAMTVEAGGKILLLNGASSAGKSTLAKAIQRQIDEPFWHVSSDQFVDAQMLPSRRDEGDDFAWSVMRPRFFDAFHGCLPAMASAGNNLIVDHVIEFESWMNDLVVLLAPYDVFFVGVHCPLAELERRERERKNRAIGEGQDHLEVVHTFGDYDYEIDTTTATPDENAYTLICAWHERRRPSTFQRMIQDGIIRRQTGPRGSQMDKVVETYWRAYCDKLPNDHEAPRLFEAFGFGDTPEMADDLGGLVVAGIKTATCSLLWEYETEDEPLPKVDDFSIVLDGQGKPLCIIQTTEMTVRPYSEVNPRFAFEEGEGDRSLAYWRKAHWDFFEPYCTKMGCTLSEEIPLVCERFRVVKE